MLNLTMPGWSSSNSWLPVARSMHLGRLEWSNCKIKCQINQCKCQMKVFPLTVVMGYLGLIFVQLNQRAKDEH